MPKLKIILINMKLQTTTKLLNARDFLQAITQISFSYSTLNRQYPIDRLTEDSSKELSQAYLDLISRVKKLAKEHEIELHPITK